MKHWYSEEQIKTFSSSDIAMQAEEEGDFRARIGQCWFLGLDSGAVTWKSQMSKLVSLSPTELDIDGLIKAIKDCIWMRGLLCELGYPKTRSTVIFQDTTRKANSKRSQLHLTGRFGRNKQSLWNWRTKSKRSNSSDKGIK